MNKNIVVVAGEPYSVFLELLFKSIKSKKIKKPFILICSKKLLIAQMKKLKFNIKVNIIDKQKIGKIKLPKNGINVLDVKFNFKKTFDKISNNSSKYIENCFSEGLSIIKTANAKVLINGPVSKKHFLKKKFLGVTEYIAKKSDKKGQEVMLIYNNKLSVSPITTHLPLQDVKKNITTKKIVGNIITINSFYKNKLKKKPKFAITGLNPHCETVKNFSEEKKIILPAIKKLRKKNINISGPFAADTVFLNKNINKFDVVIGMYHDQVLTPFKALYGFKAINVTLGLPFLRLTPDHGPNSPMLGKNKSNPASLIETFKFLSRIREN
jgi:4-hydroxythreonine-4-phosphate dehydrogenase